MRLVSRCQRNPADFPYAIRSFIGYLEGTGKSLHTIQNYRLDLEAFQDFMTSGAGDRPLRLRDLNPRDLEHYHSWLKGQGLKNNTRRRKLLTVYRFLAYLSRRKKLPEEMGRKYPAPHKIERVPLTVPHPKLLEAIRALPCQTVLESRNRALLWLLAETGCLVSEVGRLRFEAFENRPSGAEFQNEVRFDGKGARKVPVSSELLGAILELNGASDPERRVFEGFNKFGSLGTPISSRGVELLVRHSAPRLGFPELTPRTFRHSAVLQWFREGISRDEIQKRLGLKTQYAFRVFEPLLQE